LKNSVHSVGGPFRGKEKKGDYSFYNIYTEKRRRKKGFFSARNAFEKAANYSGRVTSTPFLYNREKGGDVFPFLSTHNGPLRVAVELLLEGEEDLGKK